MLINGIQYSWSSLTLEMNGLQLPGVLAIDYDDGLNPGKIRGPNPDIRGWTTGQYEANGMIRVTRTQFEAFKLALGGPGFMERVFVLLVAYFEPEIGVVTDTITARIGTNKVSAADSPDAIATEHALQILAPILWNGSPGVLTRL